jgi:hypothetical protein
VSRNRPAKPRAGAKKKSASRQKKDQALGVAGLFVLDDPIRLYLKEIGKVSLPFGRPGVDLAKRIEEGEILIENAVLESTLWS